MSYGDELLNDPIAWGRELIVARDIDPIYDMLVGANLPRSQLAKWLMAYWCFYHAGFASFASSKDTFWNVMTEAAFNETSSPAGGRWPRSTERRHFRGAKAVRTVEWMAYHFTDLEVTLNTFGIQAESVMSDVQDWPQFGPWIAFKVADMLERVWGHPIKFPRNVVFYDSPSRGIGEMADMWGISRTEMADKLIGSIRERDDPPGLKNRLCGVQEAETIACKWHSARGGHYYIGKDLHEIRQALDGWGDTAKILSRHLPPEIKVYL